MSDVKIDFEDFLQEQHILENPHMIKDQIVDDFNDWLGDIDADEWIAYANAFAKKLLKNE